MRKSLLVLSAMMLISAGTQARLVNPTSMNGLQMQTRGMVQDNALSHFRNVKAYRVSGMDRIKDSKRSAKFSFGAPSIRHDNVKSWRQTRAESELTVNLAVDYVKWAPQSVVAYAPGGIQVWFSSEDEAPVKVSSSVPDGTYQVIGYFDQLDEEGYSVGAAMVVAEDVVVSGASSITLDPETATQTIMAQPMNKAGQPFEMTQLGFVNTPDGPDIQVFKEGNVGNDVELRNCLYHKDLGELFWAGVSSGGSDFIGTEDYPDEGGTPFYEMGALKVNPTSNNFMIITNFRANPDGVCTFLEMGQKGTSSATLTNGSAALVESEVELSHTGLAALSPFAKHISENPMSINIMHDYKGMSFSSLDFKELPVGEATISYCNGASSVIADYVATAEGELEDYIYTFTSDTTYDGDWMWVTEEKTYSSLFAPKIELATGKMLNLTSGEYYTSTATPAALADRVPAALRHSAADIDYDLGTSPAYCPVIPRSYKEGNVGLLYPFGIFGYGYAGESTGVYNSLSVPEIVYAGKAVDYDVEYYSDFWSGGFAGWCYDWNQTNPAPGPYSFRFESPMVVDDLNGKLAIRYEFDNSREDCVPPGLQYMQLLDDEGKVNYGTDTKNGAKLLLMAGDFKWIGGEDGHLEYAADCMPRVDYAPFGIEMWETMQLTKKADAYDCFGALYEADLAQVSMKAPDGWFSVKISMKDASGNINEQIIAPAFQIDEQAGVARLAADMQSLSYSNGVVSMKGDACMMRVFNAQGAQMAAAFGNSISLKSMAAGVYIIKADTAAGKRVLKIVK